MVRDGIYYAAGMALAAALVGWLTTPWLAAVPLLLGAFLLWFFRDPERQVPPGAGLVVSPADGKVTDVSTITLKGEPRLRVSIFLNVFDVHVNRAPIAGQITAVEYRRGSFHNAMSPSSSLENEQNVVTLEGDDGRVVFSQIAGLVARRIVFRKRLGERVERGERVGMIKFGSRVDVWLPVSAAVQVEVGQRVKAGASVLAHLPVGQVPGEEPALAGGRRAAQ